MSAAAWAALFGGAAFLATVFGTIFVTGKLVRRLEEHDDKLVAHGVWLLKHDSILTDHAQQLAERKGFQDGMKAGQQHGR